MSKRKCHYLGDGVIACGEEPTAADLAEIEKFKRYLAGQMTRKEMREFAGLSVGQAAKLSGVSREAIVADEDGTTPLDVFSAHKLAKIYKGDVK